MPISQVCTDKEGCLLIIQLTLQEEDFIIANIYAPTQSESRDQLAFMEGCENMLSNLNIHSLFMGGDFNVQLSSPPGPTGSISNSSATLYKAHIHSIMDDYSLLNIWREKTQEHKRDLP